MLTNEGKRAHAMLDAELRLISDIQLSLLPPALPQLPGLDLAVHYRPATRAGGDYYDFFPLPDGNWSVLIADASGHGSPAAVEMAITRTLAHIAAQEMTEPGPMLDSINRNLTARGIAARGAFVTAFLAAYDPQALIDSVIEGLSLFTNGRELADDLTLLVARVTAD